MSKFKVGDFVKILHTDYIDTGLDVGTVHQVAEAGEGYVELVSTGPANEGTALYFYEREVEIAAAPTNTLTPGQTYTSANGSKWECLVVRGGVAWLAGVLGDDLYGTAYRFKLDGEPMDLGSSADEYRILFEPAREDISVRLYYSTMYGFEVADDGARADIKLSIPLIDGVFDVTQAKVEAAR